MPRSDTGDYRRGKTFIEDRWYFSQVNGAASVEQAAAYMPVRKVQRKGSLEAINFKAFLVDDQGRFGSFGEMISKRQNRYIIIINTVLIAAPEPLLLVE